jgi:putative ABC transport system ATP-binding protein
MIKPNIELRDIKIIYNLGKSNEVRAANGASIEIYPEEYIVLFGPSGCGKSTLLYCILGALPPTFGELIVNDENPYSYSPKRMVQYQQDTVGIVYQAFYLIPSLTVLNNVALPQIFGGIPSAQRKDRAMQLLRRFEVDEQADKLPTALSGGQQQRVAVARSLVNNPEILLADEPVGNLDSISAEKVMDTLEEINQKDKKTVILVSHDAKYLPYAHRVYYMKDGKIDREVANPEKAQIKKTKKTRALVTELETLARIYPYLSQEELKVKSIINYLTREINIEQILRLERTVETMIKGRINKDRFFQVLSNPFARGGVGIHQATAKKMAEKIEKILIESREIRRYRREESVEEKKGASKEKALIQKLRAYVLDMYEGEVTPIQVERLEEAIIDRISGVFKKNDFQKQLSRSIKQGGIGFKRRTSENLTLYLEKLLAQGI